MYAQHPNFVLMFLPIRNHYPEIFLRRFFFGGSQTVYQFMADNPDISVYIYVDLFFFKFIFEFILNVRMN